MTQYHTAESAVGGDPQQLRGMAKMLIDGSRRSDDVTEGLRRAVTSTVDEWRGKDAEAYRARANKLVESLDLLPPPLATASTAYDDLATALDSAQRAAGAAMQRSVDIGLAPGDLVGRPWSVATFVMENPEQLFTVARLIYGVMDARGDANDARDEFVRKMGRVRADIGNARGDHPDQHDSGGDRRGNRYGPDGRSGRRIRGDGILGRSEGGGGDGHFSSDWAGRAILERYLLGGDDWVINDDPNWSRYMMNNEDLRNQLVEPTEKQAKDALRNYLSGHGQQGTFNRTFHADIQNGEGIVGYQYLHGTNKTVGDFNFRGDTTVEPRPNGTYEVTVKGGYTWNDRIDPNPQYSTDRWKSTLAEVVTLGAADPYDIHITWHAESKVILDKHGKVISTTGYPAP